MLTLSEALFGCVSRFQTYNSGLSVCVTTMCGCWGTSLILLTCIQTSNPQTTANREAEGVPHSMITLASYAGAAVCGGMMLGRLAM